MILGIDTDVLVHWAMDGAQHHRAVRRFIEREIAGASQLGLTPQVLYEFLHVCTDPRRFESPLRMREAIDISRSLWDGKETVHVVPDPTVFHRTIELLGTLRLGRRRILDTTLAATFEAAGVTNVVTLNGADFRSFPFLRVVDPTKRSREGPRLGTSVDRT